MSEPVEKIEDRLEEKTDKTKSPWRETWNEFKKNKIALAGIIIVLIFILIAIFASFLAKEGINEQVMSDRLQPPSKEYWLGTDDFGRDIFSRVIHGARISLWVGFSSVIGSVIVGSILGIIAGDYGRWVDTIISRVFDIMLAFPSLVLAGSVVAGVRPSVRSALAAIASLKVPHFGRLIRSKVLSLKEAAHMLAAKGVGMRDRRILFSLSMRNSGAPA